MSLRIFWGFIPHPSHGVGISLKNLGKIKLLVDGGGCVFVCVLVVSWW